MDNIINECKKLINRDWDIKIVHVFRETNVVANWMSKKALDRTRGLCVFDHLTREMLEWLEQDLRGPSIVWRVGSD